MWLGRGGEKVWLPRQKGKDSKIRQLRIVFRERGRHCATDSIRRINNGSIVSWLLDNCFTQRLRDSHSDLNTSPYLQAPRPENKRHGMNVEYTPRSTCDFAFASQLRTRGITKQDALKKGFDSTVLDAGATIEVCVFLLLIKQTILRSSRGHRYGPITMQKGVNEASSALFRQCRHLQSAPHDSYRIDHHYES